MNRSVLALLIVAAPLHAFAADVIVSAAASLSNSFSEIGKLYEAKHPGDKIIANFAASDVLLKQIEQGAPADVFASADEQTMDRAAQSNAIDTSTRKDFAANTLVLIVGANAKSPSKLDDIGASDFAHIAIGNPDSVPAGRYAKASAHRRRTCGTKFSRKSCRRRTCGRRSTMSRAVKRRPDSSMRPMPKRKKTKSASR